ncbi:MAG: porin [Chitinophagales bacterium]
MNSIIYSRFFIVRLFVFLLAGTSNLAMAQGCDSLAAAIDSTAKKGTLTFTGYAEAFYCYDFSRRHSGYRQPFFYSYNRSNQVNLNLALAKLNYEARKWHFNFAVMAGTYAVENFSEEVLPLRFLNEANIGVKLSSKKNLWLDGGVFVSHIGFESAIGRDCWTLTRSILADNSPYMESGLKLTYTSKNEKWIVAGLVLNGWQRIYRANENYLPAFGHQLVFQPISGLLLNSSSFVGWMGSYRYKQLRLFHNLFLQWQANSYFGITAGFDVGAQQQLKKYAVWYSPVLIARIIPFSKMRIAFRGEYYSDSQMVIIAVGGKNGFESWGYSMNVDFQIHPKIVWRFEGRGLSSASKIYERNGKAANHNFFVTSALALTF